MRHHAATRLIRTLLLAGLLLCAARAVAIETTYGEDPVPNSHYGNPPGKERMRDGFVAYGYGIDPIPAKTLPERLQEWRASRGLPQKTPLFYRQAPYRPNPNYYRYYLRDNGVR
jgi:hypothetical protein